MDNTNRSHQPDNSTEDQGILVVIEERPLSRDDRLKIDMDPEDAMRALLAPRRRDP